MKHWIVISIVAACSVPNDHFQASHTDGAADSSSIDAAEVCTEGVRRCDDTSLTECQSGSWVTIRSCDDVCSAGACVTPPSCSGGVAICGTSGADTCCRSLPVVGGTFSRSYDGVTSGFTNDQYRATITPFWLDKYEVSVARFQKFVDAYPASKPVTGTGANPRDSADPGWLASWTTLLPAAKSDLQAMLVCGTATSQQGPLPVRCVTWYAAQAFCIWDQGRLPTEAEWNLVASGADEQRVYPWSAPASSTMIGPVDAVYGGQTAPASAGSHSDGDGRWGQSDLGGNVNEWVFDNFASPYSSDTCNDCANHTASTMQSVRGGSYASVAASLLASFRGGFPAGSTSDSIGFRCARDPVK